jgi:hypothetical protein
MTTCLHKDKRCASWEACARRTAETSAERARELIAYGQEVGRLRRELDIIAEYVDDTTDSDEFALTKVLKRSREAVADSPSYIVSIPWNADPTPPESAE